MPRLLDLYCGAGGAALGYYRMGFEVVGVDIEQQMNYPFEFYKADALEFPLTGFDAIHASPPCQRWSIATCASGTPDSWPDLIEPTRKRLRAAGVPYVMENVGQAPLWADIVLCGTMFGLGIRRHRHFETNWLYDPVPACKHQKDDQAFLHRDDIPYLEKMGVYWMTVREMREAIPPAFTEWIGQKLMDYLEGEPGEVDEVLAITSRRNWLPRRTHCPAGHLITEEYQRLDGRLRCAECERNWSRERMRKLRADRKAGIR